MRKLFIEVEWVENIIPYLPLDTWTMKTNDKHGNIAQITELNGLFYNHRGEILKDDNGNQVGYDSLKAAKTAVEDHFSAQHLEMMVNNMEVQK